MDTFTRQQPICNLFHLQYVIRMKSYDFTDSRHLRSDVYNPYIFLFGEAETSEKTVFRAKRFLKVMNMQPGRLKFIDETIIAQNGRPADKNSAHSLAFQTLYHIAGHFFDTWGYSLMSSLIAVPVYYQYVTREWIFHSCL